MHEFKYTNLIFAPNVYMELWTAWVGRNYRKEYIIEVAALAQTNAIQCYRPNTSHGPLAYTVDNIHITLASDAARFFRRYN